MAARTAAEAAPVAVPLPAPGDDVTLLLSFVTPSVVNWWLYAQAPGAAWALLGHGTDPASVTLSATARRVPHVRPGTQVQLVLVLNGAPLDVVQGDLTFVQHGATLAPVLPIRVPLDDTGVQTARLRAVLT